MATKDSFSSRKPLTPEFFCAEPKTVHDSSGAAVYAICRNERPCPEHDPAARLKEDVAPTNDAWQREQWQNARVVDAEGRKFDVRISTTCAQHPRGHGLASECPKADEEFEADKATFREQFFQHEQAALPCCPRCGASIVSTVVDYDPMTHETTAIKVRFHCGSKDYDEGRFDESGTCARRQRDNLLTQLIARDTASAVNSPLSENMMCDPNSDRAGQALL